MVISFKYIVYVRSLYLKNQFGYNWYLSSNYKIKLILLGSSRNFILWTRYK